MFRALRWATRQAADSNEPAVPVPMPRPDPFANPIPSPAVSFDHAKAAARAELLPYLDEVGLFKDLGGIVAQYCEPEVRWLPRFPNNVTYR